MAANVNHRYINAHPESSIPKPKIESDLIIDALIFPMHNRLHVYKQDKIHTTRVILLSNQYHYLKKSY